MKLDQHVAAPPSSQYVNDRAPNFRNAAGVLQLALCYFCGLANYGPSVPTGDCTWCGWKDHR